MINGSIEQFLDTGWYSEAILFCKGHVYRLEAQTDDAGTIFFTDKWRAENEEDMYYHSILQQNDTLPWTGVSELHGNDLDLLKKRFLETPVFKGKTFW